MRNARFPISVAALLLLCHLPLWAGDGDTEQRFQMDLTLSGAGTDGDAIPYLLTTSQYGSLSPSGNQLYLRPFGQYWLKRHNFHLEVGIDLIAYSNTEKDYYGQYLQLQQCYAQASWKKFMIALGQKQTKDQLIDNPLSSGNMVISGNARPAAGIIVCTNDFVKMQILDDKVETSVSAFYGRLTDGNYNATTYQKYEEVYGPKGCNDPRTRQFQPAQHLIQDAWMHHASLFFRTQSDVPFYVMAGIEHAAMYGGIVDHTSQKAFKNFFIASLGGKGKGRNGQNSQFNHLIAFDGKAKYKCKRWSVALYRQIYADDMDGNTFHCGMDGITGIDLHFNRKPWVRNLLVEYLQTTKQGGVVYANDVYWYTDKKHLYPTAGNSSFYHDEWYGGWAHYGMALGNPLLASPIYNSDHYNDFSMNMVKALNVGVSGLLFTDMTYRIRYVHSKTWGTPFHPLLHTRQNNSGSVDLQYDWGNWKFLARVAYDRGQIFGNQWGYHCSISHIGDIISW